MYQSPSFDVVLQFYLEVAAMGVVHAHKFVELFAAYNQESEVTEVFLNIEQFFVDAGVEQFALGALSSILALANNKSFLVVAKQHMLKVVTNVNWNVLELRRLVADDSHVLLRSLPELDIQLNGGHVFVNILVFQFLEFLFVLMTIDILVTHALVFIEVEDVHHVLVVNFARDVAVDSIEVDGALSQILAVLWHIMRVQISIKTLVCAECQFQDLLVDVVIKLMKLHLTEGILMSAASKIDREELKLSIADKEPIVDVEHHVFNKFEGRHFIIFLENAFEMLFVFLTLSDDI